MTASYRKVALRQVVISAFLILHVGDSLIFATPPDLHAFWLIIAAVSRAGPKCYVDPSASFVFCGPSVSLCDTSFGLSQDAYIGNIPFLDPSQSFGEIRIPRNEKKISRTTSAIAGGCICRCQARYEVPFLTFPASTLRSGD